MATELQRMSRGKTLYILDELTTGQHPSDVETLVTQLDALVVAGNTVVVVEHDTRVIANSDWVIDMGPNAGDEGGREVALGTPADVAQISSSRTAPFLANFLNNLQRGIQQRSRTRKDSVAPLLVSPSSAEKRACR